MTSERPNGKGYDILAHIVALAVVMVWGSTFAFTKLLLTNGISAAQIFALRFTFAYITLLAYNLYKGHNRWFSFSFKDELKMLVLGISGGSIYFLAENSSMNYTTATNTSLIVCACPLFTTFIIAWFYKTEHICRRQVFGTLVAIAGMAMVVMNGQFVLQLSPKGDLLAFGACMSWVVYSLVMMDVNKRYDIVFITRKVFFYGTLTIMPYFVIYPEPLPVEVLLRGDIMTNLLFLSVVGSTLCFLLWNWSLMRIGVVVTTNYIYLTPVATILFAWWLIDEPVTLWLILGTALLLWGLFLVNKKGNNEKTIET